jgi:hypothetical protein
VQLAVQLNVAVAPLNWLLFAGVDMVAAPLTQPPPMVPKTCTSAKLK